jgi:hypothetical protein
VLVLLFVFHRGAGCVAALAAFALVAYLRRAWWLAACAAAWVAVFLAVLTIPGPYDSWAGRSGVPVLAGYALCFLVGWALGRWLQGRRTIGRHRLEAADAQLSTAARVRPTLDWPAERRLLLYLCALLAVAVGAALVEYRGVRPPLLAANPDAARAALGQRSSIAVGLLAEAWTLGMAVSLLRALTGGPTRRWLYATLTVVFAVGAGLGASKNSVLVGIVPAVVAALSVRRRAARPPRVEGPVDREAPAPRRWRVLSNYRVVALVGLVAVAAAVYFGGQRTLAGTGAFEDQFRARYGGNPIAASVGSLDLSLSSSAETFGRLWAQRDALPPRYGAYSLQFLGHHEQALFGPVNFYAITGQLSAPYYMNTATFVAIPLLDFGPIGAAVMLLLLGIGTGIGERRLEFSAGPAQQLGRAFIVYFAAFGIYELYPALYATWISLAAGLWVLHRLRRAAR